MGGRAHGAGRSACTSSVHLAFQPPMGFDLPAVCERLPESPQLAPATPPLKNAAQKRPETTEMAVKVVEIFETLEYGPAPESAAPANSWLDAHGRRVGHFIDGRWVEPAAGEYFESFDPAHAR